MIQTRPSSALRRRRALFALFFAFVLAATACGSSDETSAPDTSNSDTTEPATAPADEGPSDAAESSGDTDTNSADADAGDTDTATTSGADPKRARLGDQLLVADQSVSSGRFEAVFTVIGSSELPEGLEFTMEGAFDNATQSSEVSLDFGAIATAMAAQEGTDVGPFAAMLEEPMVVRTIGERSFISWGLLTMLTGGQGTWIEGDADDTEGITSEFGAGSTSSPTALLEALEDANAEITEIGTEEVRGVTTTHTRALVDLAELESTMSAEERASLEDDLGDLSMTDFPIDFWVDGDGLLRRYSMEIEEIDPDTGATDNVVLVFEFFDYGADIQIDVPPADQIISGDELDLGALGF